MVTKKSSKSTKRSKKKSRKAFKYRPQTAAKIKERAERSRGGFDRMLKDSVPEFRPAEHENRIRILPPTWGDEEYYGLDVFVHYGIGPDEQSYLCREKTVDKDCPICDEAKEAHRKGEEEYVKELGTSSRVAVYVIDRDKEDDGPKVWLMPSGVEIDLAFLVYDKRSGEVMQIADPEDGYDVEFERIGTGLKTKYKGLKIVHRSTPLSEDEELAEEWMEFVVENPIPDTLKFYSVGYLQKVFGGEIEREDDDEAEDEGGAPDEDEIMEMTKKELQAEIDEHDLDIDLDNFKKLKDKRFAVAEALHGEEGDPEEDDDDKSSEVPDEDEINAMKKKELEEVIKEHELDVDLDDYEKLKEKRAAVVEAISDSGGGEEEEGEEEEEEVDSDESGDDDGPPTEDEMDEMDEGELEEVIKDYGLDVDASQFADTKKGLKSLRSAVWEEISDQYDTEDSGEEEEEDPEGEDEEEAEEDEDDEDDDNGDEQPGPRSVRKGLNKIRKGKRKSDKKKSKKKRK